MTPRVLVVEDDPDIALIARELLAVSGLEAVSAYTVNEALELLAASAFDLAVVDLQLPDRSGWELIENARAMRPGLPVVIYSVHADQPETVARATEVGASVVSKSADPSALVDMVTSLLAAGASA